MWRRWYHRNTLNRGFKRPVSQYEVMLLIIIDLLLESLMCQLKTCAAQHMQIQVMDTQL